MGRLVIAVYRPLPGQSDTLLEVVRQHLPILRSEELVTERPAYAMRAKDGTIIEVFEWKSPEAIAAAHANPQVLAMWERFAAACEFVPLAAVAEAHELFSEFEPLAL